MGKELLAKWHAVVRSATELDGIACVLRFMTRGRQSGRWQRNWWRRDYRHLEAELIALRDVQNQARGRCGVHRIRHAWTGGSGTLIDERSREVKPSTLTPGAVTMTLAEMVSWRWIALRVMEFYSHTSAYPLPSRFAEQFQRFCDLVVANYSSLLMRPGDMDTLRAYSPTGVEWSLVNLDGEIKLRLARYPRPREWVGAIRNHSQLEELIGKASNRRIQRREQHRRTHC